MIELDRESPEGRRLMACAEISIGYLMGLGYHRPAFYMWTEATGWNTPLVVNASDYPRYWVAQFQ